MLLVKKNKCAPTHHSNSLWHSDFMNDFWGQSFQDFPGWDSQRKTPSANIKEDDKSFQIELAVPGLTKEDIKVVLDDGKLTLSAELKKDEKKEDEKILKREFHYHSFKRQFSLPKEVESNKISASYNNGVLLVTVPKSKSSKEDKQKTISVQ